jgi:hypothetical protein
VQWKPALNAFAFTFADRVLAAENHHWKETASHTLRATVHAASGFGWRGECRGHDKAQSARRFGDCVVRSREAGMPVGYSMRLSAGSWYVPSVAGCCGWYMRRIGRNGPSGVGSQFAAATGDAGRSRCR